MTTKKKANADSPDAPIRSRPRHSEEYERLLAGYTAALELLHAGKYAEAQRAFADVAATGAGEWVLAERARTHERICARRAAPPAALPNGADELYHLAVMHANAGNGEQARQLLDQALAAEPNSARLLYARSSAWAIQGHAEGAVADLRKAISAEPALRFQAANDPDFERIREEPAFIDVIEPSPAGA
ncbi:MAG TPA: tetratricopeptide repeat protein [Candidatus Polarisedimenticolaceae bacterium]|nr:tetratricopeptide repeat protein [Candidatus Polarisedimenticolaceae bacterium]